MNKKEAIDLLNQVALKLEQRGLAPASDIEKLRALAHQLEQAEGKEISTAKEHNQKVSKVRETLMKIIEDLEESDEQISELYRTDKEQLEKRKLVLMKILKEKGNLLAMERDELKAIIKTLHDGGN